MGSYLSEEEPIAEVVITSRLEDRLQGLEEEEEEDGEEPAAVSVSKEDLMEAYGRGQSDAIQELRDGLSDLGSGVQEQQKEYSYLLRNEQLSPPLSEEAVSDAFQKLREECSKAQNKPIPCESFLNALFDCREEKGVDASCSALLEQYRSCLH